MNFNKPFYTRRVFNIYNNNFRTTIVMDFKTTSIVINAEKVPEQSGQKSGYNCTLNGQSFWLPTKVFEKLFEKADVLTYCRKDSEVIAIQYENWDNIDEIKKFISPLNVQISTDPETEGTLYIYGDECHLVVTLYDYIVKDYLGHLRIIPPIVFYQMYKRT